VLERIFRVVSSIFLIAILVTSGTNFSFQSGIVKSTDYSSIQNAFATGPVDITQIGNYAIFGLHNVVISQNVTFNTGSAGAQNAQPNMALPANAEMIIKQNSKFVDPASAVVGDTVIINSGTSVQNVFYNELQNNGTITGTKNTPLLLPVVKSLPPFPRSTPGTSVIDVPMNGVLTLQPGQYGSITVEQGGTLNLAGGIYNVTSITAKQNSNLFFASASQVVVQNQITWNKGTFVGPSSTSGLHARDIIIFVGGNSTINQNTTSTDLGKNAIVKANMYAPTGSINMDQGTQATGSFIANTVTIQQNSIINLDSAFGIRITWIPSSLSVQAKPFAQTQLNFTSSANVTNVKVIVSSQISNLVTPSRTTLTSINSTGLQNLLVTTSIPPGTTSGWHNGTISLSLNGNMLQNSFNMNILVPTITSQKIQTSTGNLTYIATPSSSPFFTNTYNVATYFTFTNGTTIPIRVYYDIFTNRSTTIPVSLHTSISESSNVFISTYDYFESMTNKILLDFWQPREAYAVIQAATCTNYGITYHFQSYPGTISNDLAVATSSLKAIQNPLIIRNDIFWSDVDKGSFDNNGNWVPKYDNSTIDNYFNNVIKSGKKSIVILGVHSPPGAIAAKGATIFGQTYAQYAYANAANAFIDHTISRIKTLGALDRVQYWQVDNEPNTHPMLKSSSNGGILTEVVDWQTTARALNLWSSTVKTLDSNRPIIINMYQASPQDIIPQALQNSNIVFSIKPFDNLLPSSFSSSQQLATSIGVMGFDIYPEQWITPPESLTSGFNEALLQAQNQFTDVQNGYAFNGRWGIVEMPSGPNSFALTSAPVHASDISSMINATRNELISGQPPSLIGLFQLRAPNDLSLKSILPDFSNAYGLITNSNGQTNSDFFSAIQSSVVQNCPPLPPVITNPVNGTTVSSSTISGTSLAGATITIYEGTTQIGTTTADSNGNWSVSPSLSSGSHTITATQTFNGSTSAQSIAVTFTFTPPSPIFFDNFDNGPLASTGWSLLFPGCDSGPYPCLSQVSTNEFGQPPPSPPFWARVGQLISNPFCSAMFASSSKSFTVSQPGNYQVTAVLSPSICDVCTERAQIYMDNGLVFDAPGTTIFGTANPSIVNGNAVVNLAGGSHTVTMAATSNIACSGFFAAYFDDIKVQSTSSPVTPVPVGGPYFTIQVNQTSFNATRPSTIVVPIKLVWNQGYAAESVSAKFVGNTTSVVPSITSVTNTTSYQLFKINLNVPSNT
jgi:hypothetical protein